MASRIKLLLTALVFLMMGAHYTYSGGYILGVICMAISVVAIVVILLTFAFPNASWLPKIPQEKPKKRDFQEAYNDLGIFTYHKDGFEIQIRKKPMNIRWDEIQTMLAHKDDHFITDCIVLEVYRGNLDGFRVTEETPGWYQFLERCYEQFPTIDKTWTLAIMTPPFATSLTLVYDRAGRSLEEVMKAFYAMEK